jgi:uncharacterized protein YnzC (UPF0291/DUF896 family)
MKKNETRVVCPNCGAEFEIPEHESVVRNATVIGSDSGLGTVYLKLKDRQEQLKSAGIDITKYFSMKTPGGKEKIMKWDGDTPVPVTPDDPVLRAIFEAGTVPSRDLFRRWVMAQVFQGLMYKGYRGKEGFVDWVHRHGYKYQWTMTEEELRVQAKLEKKDLENFQKRNRWFNINVVDAMCSDYMKKLKNVINEKKIHKCKGIPYICIGGGNVFVSDIQGKILRPLILIHNRIKHCRNAADLYKNFCEFRRNMIGLHWDTPQCTKWLDAYKGAGAYYTLENMIRFHDCFIKNDYTTSRCKCKFLSKSSSLDYLESKADEYRNEGWKLFGLLKKFLQDNNVNIKAKQEEWANAKRMRTGK